MDISEEKLIILVKDHKHLYDLLDLNYYNSLAREKSYEKIGQTLKITGNGSILF